VQRVDEVVRGPVKSKTLFPAIILHLIAQRPDHGYGLMQRTAELCGDLLAVNTNTVYPLLRRLEERGFVTASWEHPTKRSRRVYAITKLGEQRLERIKGLMLPYLDSIAGAIERLKTELYR
jgi:PadR family transcriptional regulator, regulatory protein PadR